MNQARAWRVTAIAAGLATHLLAGGASAQEGVGATVKGDLGYLTDSAWEDAKALARAPLSIGKLTEATPGQVLVGALVVGSIGGMIGLDGEIRERARYINDASALRLQQSGMGLLAGGLTALYGAGLWQDNQEWRHRALTGIESTVVAWGFAYLAKVAFGRERPDEEEGHLAWFDEDGRSFVSGDTTPAFAMAEALSAAFDHAWWVTLPAYTAATAVGVGRMGRDRHWASDILASAFLGVGTAKLFNYLHRKREQAGPRVTVSPLAGPGEIGLRVHVFY